MYLLEVYPYNDIHIILKFKQTIEITLFNSMFLAQG